MQQEARGWGGKGVGRAQTCAGRAAKRLAWCRNCPN